MSDDIWQGRYDSLFIGGEWVAPSSSEKITVISPFTEQPIAQVPAGTVADIDRAVAAARKAFDEGPWPRMTLAERIDVLRALSAELAANEETMARLVTAEMGSPIAHSVPIQATRPRLILDEMISLAQEYPFDEVREAASGRARVLRRARGVLGAVVPWNAPHLVTLMKLAPALLTGCTAVVKASPETPLDQYLFAELAQRAGLPAGVLNIVAADREPSEHLITHPGVDMISFTGSTPVGKRIASLCGGLVRRATLELGGKSAAIVLDDVDVPSIAETLVHMAFRNNGEVCTAKTRFIVPRRLSGEITEAVVETVRRLPVGDPFDPATYFGPLVTSTHRDRVEGMIRGAVAQGATAAIGGGRPAALPTGWFVEPTIFTGVTSSMTIAQDEVFGPVGLVLEYDTVEEALAIANDSRYGLSGSVFGGDAARAADVAARMETGMVEVNGCPAGLAAPFGGVKESGIGYELGLEGFDEFVEVKSIGIPRDLVL
ncbi:aldehyde dehydrogenase [Microbacterium sp. No. 7]|uniref:aldehyde dehydrogenase n=1 Tax=Microbacterium sp. No. 7 TaxID=1714373 RepID=UPI0006D12A5D|nr:aldehyde dehydrogenase [Microbacterium sp. No. 7]ALJ19264.1 aldehyde dehydrogenase [Microbacterium sp. No. 7]